MFGIERHVVLRNLGGERRTIVRGGLAQNKGLDNCARARPSATEIVAEYKIPDHPILLINGNHIVIGRLWSAYCRHLARF